MLFPTTLTYLLTKKIVVLYTVIKLIFRNYILYLIFYMKHCYRKNRYY